MDLNAIRHLSAAKKMKCSSLDYVQLLIISLAGWWTQTPCTTPLQPEIWNACFWIMFNFCWSAGLVNGLEPYPPPLSSQKNGMLIFGLCSLLMIGWAGWWTRTPSTTPLQPKNELLIFGLHSTCDVGQAGLWTWAPSATPLQPKKWNAHFWITFNFWWSARLVDGLKPHAAPLPSQKNEMLIFGLHSTSDDQLGWSMVSNPFHHPSPAKKTKSLLLDYVQLLMISQAGEWTQTPSATSLQPKKWNAHFWIMFNFW